MSIHYMSFVRRVGFSGAVVIGMMLVLSLLVTKRFWTAQKEGMVSKKSFTVFKGKAVYDDFYASVYDNLFYSKVKNRFEIGEIVNSSGPTTKAVILDIGSGTGHHVAGLQGAGYDVRGIDCSAAMIAASRMNYPDSNYIHEDATNSLAFDENTFTTITCLYFTIYEIENKVRFFESCAKWLKPGGRLIVHVVDLKSFRPTVPASEKILYLDPQDYTSNRITDSKVEFDTHSYSAKYKETEQGGRFTEVWTDAGGGVRKHEHPVVIIPHREIIQAAQQAGFIVEGKTEMKECDYIGQYLYTLVKPN